MLGKRENTQKENASEVTTSRLYTKHRDIIDSEGVYWESYVVLVDQNEVYHHL